MKSSPSTPDVLTLCKQFIAIPSTKDIPQSLDDILDFAQKQVNEFTIERFEKDGIPSLLIYNTPKRPDRFKVILNAHLDVVPGREDQYQSFEKDGKLFGRGTYDMKAAAAAEILVFKELAKKVSYPLALQLVTDEEIGGRKGVGYQIEQGVLTDFIIAGEPTNFDISDKAKGLYWFKITCYGRPAHGSRPWLGDNAIWKMKKFLDTLEKRLKAMDKEVWATTINLAMIDTPNKSYNKVAEECSIYLDVRHIPEEEKKIRQQIESILPNDFKLEIILDEPFQKAEEDIYIYNLKSSIKKIANHEAQYVARPWASDVRLYTDIGCNGVTFGPIGEGLHEDEEWVDIKSLDTYYEILKDFLLSLKEK